MKTYNLAVDHLGIGSKRYRFRTFLMAYLAGLLFMLNPRVVKAEIFNLKKSKSTEV